MKKEEIICGPDNLELFRTQIKKEKTLYALVKALYEREMIDGLRGIRLELTPEQGSEEKTPENAKKTAKTT